MNKSLILPNNLVYNNSISPEYILNESSLNEQVMGYNYTYTSRSTSHLIDIIGAPELNISSLKETNIPLAILKNHSSLEAIVCYLKEICGLRFNEIALLLNRDQRTIWVTYNNSKKKNIRSVVTDSNTILDSSSNTEYTLSLPTSIFTSRTFSVLESIVFYLRTNYDLSFNQISELLGKNYRTIWTVYRRALQKLAKTNLNKNDADKNRTKLNK